MANHRMFVPVVIAEDLLQLPEGTHIKKAEVVKGELVLDIASEEDLGSAEVNALYGNIEEDEKRIHFGMFEAR